MSKHIQIKHTFTNELNCIICKDPKIEKIMLYPCHHFICNICVSKLPEAKCPECRTLFSSKINLFSNKFLNMKVSCPYSECEKVNILMSHEELQNHIDKECNFSEILCECNCYINKEDWEQHKNTVCLEQNKSCEYCKIMINMKDMKIHHQIECKEIEIECSEMDCKYRASRTTILSHVIDCEFRFIKCNIDNCKKSGPYKYMKEHLNICSVWRCNICKMDFPSDLIALSAIL